MTPERLAEIRRAMAVADKIVHGPTMAGELLAEVMELRRQLDDKTKTAGNQDNPVRGPWFDADGKEVIDAAGVARRTLRAGEMLAWLQPPAEPNNALRDHLERDPHAAALIETMAAKTPLERNLGQLVLLYAEITGPRQPVGTPEELEHDRAWVLVVDTLIRLVKEGG